MMLAAAEPAPPPDADFTLWLQPFASTAGNTMSLSPVRFPFALNRRLPLTNPGEALSYTLSDSKPIIAASGYMVPPQRSRSASSSPSFCSRIACARPSKPKATKASDLRSWRPRKTSLPCCRPRSASRTNGLVAEQEPDHARHGYVNLPGLPLLGQTARRREISAWWRPRRECSWNATSHWRRR